jgi:hypothetical protein
MAHGTISHPAEVLSHERHPVNRRWMLFLILSLDNDFQILLWLALSLAMGRTQM